MSAMEPLIVAFTLILARTSSFVVAAPIFGRGTVPNMVKLGLCVALSLFWLPDYVSTTSAELQTRGALVVSLLSELIIGFSLGFIVRLVLLPARIAGTYIGQELGFNLGQVADPTTGTPMNETALLFDALGLVVFWATGVHHHALRLLGYPKYSFRSLRDLFEDFGSTAVSLVSQAHELGLLMIAPLASFLFLLLLSLMVLMRAWPQVTLFTFGMGARLLLGLCALVVVAPTIISNMAYLFDATAESVTRSIFSGP